MALLMDIDKFLKRDDFMLLAVAEWPWEINHFILRKKKLPVDYIPIHLYLVTSSFTKKTSLYCYFFIFSGVGGAI